MGGILSNIGLAAAANTLDTVLMRAGRNICGIIPDCTIEERHLDALEITEEPVEQGASVSDHAYRKPFELVLRVAWTDSKSIGQVVGSLITQGGLPTNIKDVYTQLQALQQCLQPFSIVTGKRNYDSMLMRSLQVITDKQSENILSVEATFREVIIVSTKVQSASSLGGAPLLGTAQNQANPQNSAPPVNAGAQQLQPSNAGAAGIIGGM